MKISLFVTCYNDTMFPQTGKAVVSVLERLGHTVDFNPAQTCCGQMHYNTGYQKDALPLMQRFLEMYRDVETICIPSSSCVSMMRDHYPKMAEQSGNPEIHSQVESLLPRVHEFTELLIDKLKVEDVGAFFPHKVTLHTSCHSIRSLHLSGKPERLLGNVRGLTLVDLPDSNQCCGFGGTFSIKNAEVSAAMLNEKVQRVLSTRAEICTAVDNSCLMHINGALHRQRAGMRTMHLAEILASVERGNSHER